MRIASLLQIGSIAAILLFVVGPLQAQIDDLAKQATNNPIMEITKDSKAERVIGAKGRFLARTEVVPTDKAIVDKVVQAKKAMKEIRRTAKDKGRGPQTIEEAAAFISHRINMACPPTKCVEHDGVFYFSGGTSAKPIDDFSSGLAIKKGETTIYEWPALDKPDEGKAK